MYFKVLMGIIGKRLFGYLGEKVGSFAGRKLGTYTGVKADRGGPAGRTIGETLGNLTPFKKGGRVCKTGKILAHKGEFILPKGVAPTKKQIDKVRKRGGRVKGCKHNKSRK